MNVAVLAQIAFSFCVIAVLEGIAVYTWQFRAERGARWHVAVQATKCLWLGAILVGTLGTGHWWGNAGERATWFLSIVSAYIWYRFFAEISGFDRSAPRWLEPVIRTGTLFCWLLYLSNPWHHLIAFEINRGGVLEEHYGPLCLFFTYPFGYAVNLLAVGINVRWARSCRGLRRRQAWAFLAPSLVAWAGQFLSNMSWANKFDPHAVFFLLSGVATAWAFFGWRSYSVLPQAQEAMLRDMIEGLVVVDEQGDVARTNTAAHSILPGMKEGIHFDSVARVCPDLLSPRGLSPKSLEANWGIAGTQCFSQVQPTPLFTSAGWLLGQVVCFKDITIEKEQQEHIVEQAKCISLLEESARMGRELHDGAAQSWSYVSMQLCATERRMAMGDVARADEIDAELRIASRPGEGTSITVILPLDSPSAKAEGTRLQGQAR